MSCDNLEKNRKQCPCTYSCSRKGACCECVAYHRHNRELPACYFNPQTEATYDRSIEAYLKQK